jgi:hypothetical protein
MNRSIKGSCPTACCNSGGAVAIPAGWAGCRVAITVRLPIGSSLKKRNPARYRGDAVSVIARKMRYYIVPTVLLATVLQTVPGRWRGCPVRGNFALAP